MYPSTTAGQTEIASSEIIKYYLLIIILKQITFKSNPQLPTWMKTPERIGPPLLAGIKPWMQTCSNLIYFNILAHF